jgi:pantothenate kinase
MADHAPLVLHDDAITKEAQRLIDLAHQTPGRRFMLGIAGIAGSGKTTLADRLVEAIHSILPGVGAAEAIPMDGFHLPNARLEREGWTRRKGADFTYDARAYFETLRRFRDPRAVGPFPVYCRRIHEPIDSSRQITERTRLIVTEGLYLLSNLPPWDQLAGVLDEAWWIDLPPETARLRLRQRDLGVGRSVEAADAKYQANDRLNTEHVLTHRRAPDRVVCWPPSP